MERRDTKFFSELKQMNEDLIKFLKETQDKSPYFDFTPTLNDYVKQFTELDKKYPEKSSTFPGVVTSLPTITSTAAAAATAAATAATTTTTTTTSSSGAPAPFFSFTGAANNIFSGLNNDTNTGSSMFAGFGNQKPAENPPSLGGGGGAGGASLFANLITTKPSLGATNSTPIFGSFNTTQQTTLSSNTIVQTNDTNNDASNVDAGDDDAPPPEPNVDKYDEPDSKYSVKCKLYERGKGTDLSLLGVGQLFIKPMGDPNKRQVIFRQDPDLRRVLVNEVLTPSLPVKLLPKAVHMIFPTPTGSTKSYIAKVKEETDASNLVENLKFNQG